MKEKFSVLISVYKKEKPKYLREALNSIYDFQTLKPSEIVLVEDGELTPELYSEIEYQKKRLKEILKIIKLKKNSGLGKALEIGLLNCSNEWIARMDTDDIAYPKRFEKQFSLLEKRPEIDVLGTYMSEFLEENINDIICIKDAPNKNIGKYIKYRDPVNHPTVILKKSKVLEAGNYQEIFLNEDSYLWRRMFKCGAIFANIEEPLLYFRITNDTYKRRGGWNYIKAEYILQKKCLEMKIINYLEFLFNIFGKTLIRLLPNTIRKFFYLYLLRKK